MLITFPGLEPMPLLWLQITSASAWVLLIILIAWVVSRFTNSEAEIIRKIVHIGTGNVILLAWWLNIPAFLGITAAILASIITLLSYIFPILPGINSVGRQSLGTFFYAVSIGILVAWFWYLQLPQYAALGILIMAWGDGLAALIGQKFGQHKYKLFGSQKSWEGSLTMTLISFLISNSILLATQSNIWQIWIISIAVAIVATLLEAFSFLGIDNLTVPLGSAALAYMLTQLLL
ncbi:diacylglycerol/polyprenol kinase family protein [Sphaerospermopsis aphanizomenoides]|uniref:diacylglycerol/polyprenol kinase family protein n=1 Tax=Sphaerospermopsis aphanizomenoides TaxID=459663 RepID=UPI002D80CB7B|nr:SEC59/DGK1/VTE5 family protein [Sphaerospermopsis aphanizomenoides]